MPPNRVANIRRKWRAADNSIVHCLRHLADIYITLAPQHPELAGMLFAYMLWLDGVRQFHLAFYRQVWSGTERGLWKAGEFGTIVDEAKLVPDPKAR